MTSEVAPIVIVGAIYVWLRSMAERHLAVDGWLPCVAENAHELCLPGPGHSFKASQMTRDFPSSLTTDADDVSGREAAG